MKKIGLALSGGGTLGAFQAGVLSEIKELVNFSVVTGSSIGAVNACLLYGGCDTALHDFWADTGKRGISEFADIFKLGGMLLSGEESYVKPRLDFWNILLDGLYAFESSPISSAVLKNVDFSLINKLSSPKISICATDIKTGRERIFENTEINIENLTASFSIPEVFPFQKIGDDWFWDGAYTKNPPLMPHIKEGVDEIWLIRLIPEKGDVPRSKDELKKRINEVVFSSALRTELEYINLLNSFALKVPELRSAYKKIEVVEVSLDMPLTPLSALLANEKSIEKLYSMGKEKALVFKNRI
jgi:NTE family protein